MRGGVRVSISIGAHLGVLILVPQPSRTGTALEFSGAMTRVRWRCGNEAKGAGGEYVMHEYPAHRPAPA